MEKTYVGTVISTINSPSPSSVDFVVTNETVHRGQFVEMEHEHGIMLALITNVVKTNKYFERADSVKEFEASGKAILEQFPTAEWEYIVANTRPLGIFTESGIKRPSVPPSPGTKVYLARESLLKKFYGFDDNGVYLGRLEFHDLDVKLNMTKLLKKHLAVLSISGAGKSHTVACIIEELLERKKEQGRIACIVFDPHGEYSSFAEPAKQGYVDYSDKTLLIQGKQIRIGVPNLNVGMLAGIIPGISLAQRRELSRILSELKKEMRSGNGPFDLSKLKDAIASDSEIKTNTKSALLAWLSELESLHLFGKTDLPSIRDIVMPGKLAVIDLSDIIDLRKKQIIVSYFAHKLFNERRKQRIAPFLLVVEEAHQFTPEKASEEQAVSREILRTIAREGRKFGASLCLISQRPVQLDTTTLSQCNTKLILRITNPYDLDHIAKSAEAIDKRSLDMITSLQVGEALLIGEAVGYPLFFKVRQRKSMPSKHEMTLEEAAIQFEESVAKKNSESKEYL